MRIEETSTVLNTFLGFFDLVELLALELFKNVILRYDSTLQE